MAQKAKSLDGKALDPWKAKLSNDAMDVIRDVLPTKSDQLSSYLQQELQKQPHEVRETLRSLPGSQDIMLNKQLRAIATRVEAEAREMLRIINPIRSWIKVNIPSVETEGSGFGVEVMQKLAGYVAGAEASALSAVNRVVEYYSTRALLAKKFVEYSTVKDNEEAIYELDERMYIDMLVTTRDMVFGYTVLFDIFQKNMDWIELAQKSNMGIMY